MARSTVLFTRRIATIIHINKEVVNIGWSRRKIQILKEKIEGSMKS
jgi:hypothetical protein